MCGIYASVSTNGHIHPSVALKQLLSKRGPDHLGELKSKSNIAGKPIHLSFISTILALRGGHITTQPLSDPLTGSILCWNGEAWKIGQSNVQGNDGDAILNMLVSSTIGCSQFCSIARVLEVLQSISGPFAFVYFDKARDLVYFGRDYLGRRSLLYSIDGGIFQLSSLAGDMNGKWIEVETNGIYVLALSGEVTNPSLTQFSYENSQGTDLKLYHSNRALDGPEISKVSLGRLNMSLPLETYNLNTQSATVNELEFYLKESLKPRILDIPCPPKLETMDSTKLAILFSGGLDCTVLARMAHDILPAADQIDLLNVAFENPRVIQAARPILLRRDQGTCSHEPPGVLNEIDKLSRPEKGMGGHLTEQNAEISTYESCPDRITGRKALKELQVVCPSRTWRFFAINIPYSEALSHRSKVVTLMYPHNTEMDLSIAYAMYFAARGIGLLSTDEGRSPVLYKTPARVLLSGLGADELFAGYTRHAIAFDRQGFPGLLSELELDVNRLGKRNLGRDDRVISNWGREARYPYLDEALVKWALQAPVWTKCGFGILQANLNGPQTVLEPGKKVLRLLAERLEMFSVAMEKKRAIQFGARTAKMEKGRTKDTAELQRKTLRSLLNSTCVSATVAVTREAGDI